MAYIFENKGLNMKHPTKEECQKILNEYGTPKHVQGHCNAVAETAYKIAEALNKNGYSLDLELIMAAGMLHDIARVEDEHWNVGADYMKKLGLEGEEKIIRAHMHYDPFSEVKDLTETDMVCLGDRLVKEDEYVGINERIQYIIDKAKCFGHEDRIPFILTKKKDTQRLMDEIEDVIGISIDELMKGK